MKQPIDGKLLRADADRIVVREGNAIATYSTLYYRLPLDEGKVIRSTTDPLPVDLHIGELGHAMLVVTG